MADDSVGSQSRMRTQLPELLRFGIAGLLLGPGVSKILTYDRSVQFFTMLGLPASDVLVVVVGIIELVAAALLLLDRAPRGAALLVVPIMVGAVLTAGPTWQNIGVFAAALLLVTLESLPTNSSTNG